jgi:cation diffusion facilitator CzcD-associated flavoprotein CzcO
MGTQQFDVVIVGAGFGGMGAAIQLNRLGYDDIVIVEREDDLGGTWHVNHYPGLTVDVPSTTYSYWFEQPVLVATVRAGRRAEALRRACGR